MAELPTGDDILAHALADLHRAQVALADAADWLRSDWHPAGSALTRDQADARSTCTMEIAKAKGAIDRAKAAIGRALP